MLMFFYILGQAGERADQGGAISRQKNKCLRICFVLQLILCIKAHFTV